MIFKNYSFHTPSGKLISTLGEKFDISLPKNFYVLKTFWNYSGKNIKKKEAYFTNPISSVDDKVILWKKSGFGRNSKTIKISEFVNKNAFNDFQKNWNIKNPNIKISYQYIIIAIGKEGLYKIYTRSYQNCWSYFDNEKLGNLTKFFSEKNNNFNILNFSKRSEDLCSKFLPFLEVEKQKTLNWYEKIKQNGNEILDPIQLKSEIIKQKEYIILEKNKIKSENEALKKELNKEKNKKRIEKINAEILKKENEALKKDLEQKELELLELLEINPSLDLKSFKKDFTIFIFGNSKLAPDKIKKIIAKHIEKYDEKNDILSKYSFSVEIIASQYEECKKRGGVLLKKIYGKKYREYAIFVGAEPHSLESVEKKSKQSFLPILEKKSKNFLIDIRKNQLGDALDSFKKSNLKSSVDKVFNELENNNI